MRKEELKNVLIGNVGKQLHVQFASVLGHLTGNYTVAEVGRGRGKYGSTRATLVSVADGTILKKVAIPELGPKEKEFGTSVSKFIASLETEDGTVYGSSDDGAGIASQTNSSVANQLFHSVIPFLNSRLLVPVNVSGNREFEGSWMLTGVHKVAGRQRQLRGILIRDNHSMEFWTYRHSGCISSITPETNSSDETSDEFSVE